MTLSNRLRQLRQEAKLTQSELGQKLGVTDSAVRMWETGKRSPDAETLSRIADIFGVSTDYLLGRRMLPEGSIPSWLDKVPKDLRTQIADLIATGDMGAVYLRAGVGMAKDAQLSDYPPEALEPIARAMIDAGHKIRKARARKLKNIGKGNKTID